MTVSFMDAKAATAATEVALRRQAESWLESNFNEELQCATRSGLCTLLVRFKAGDSPRLMTAVQDVLNELGFKTEVNYSEAKITINWGH